MIGQPSSRAPKPAAAEDAPRWAPGDPLRLGTRRFILRSMTRRDATPEFLRWHADPEVQRGHNLPLRRMSRQQALRSLARADNRTVFYLMIAAPVAAHPVGFYAVRADPRDLWAEITVTIGNRDFRRKGVFSETAPPLCAFLFEHLGMHKIIARIHARNTASIRAFEKAGFTREAVLREQLASVADGTRLDQLIFALWRPEGSGREPAP